MASLARIVFWALVVIVTPGGSLLLPFFLLRRKKAQLAQPLQTSAQYGTSSERTETLASARVLCEPVSVNGISRVVVPTVSVSTPRTGPLPLARTTSTTY